ncbi:Relaxase/Mobilisation nuclease domain-containing protein [Maridesulfovibrio ferrireducens]|uniref:Relaxase/Mobilisation nuclease domain-containing protein n=1 Tax=Maridesulfovibrio ferrireducens TaxID=246191 RepID=A0A1G9IBT8_9BACT|nr:relaxase/mobilization nuclease domain-containing protein [Maridesulfovibrio ferrireducens]SDL22586.1 Relaxase/Mobilisation nuclease domain-containing protein [Maridesulfovibrio ferrireducens]
MLMKVFRHGVGRGSKVIGYVTDKNKREKSPPEVLRGDPDLVCDLIDTTSRKWRYTSGVLSWAPEDKVTPENEKKLMDGFESIAFAGMEPDQYSILWVRHSHAGHHELHFVIPRTELRTDKAFNPCPPGWDKQYNPWCELHNRRHNWARPDELRRARLVSPGSSIQSYKAGNASEVRKTVTEALVQGVEAGLIHNRQDIVKTLEDFGFTVPRKGKDYITIEQPQNENMSVSQKRKNRRIRLKGVLYGESWTAEQFKQRAELSRENETADGRASADFQRDNSKRIEVLQQRVADICKTRAEYHRSRYEKGCIRGQEVAAKLDPRHAPILKVPRSNLHGHDNNKLFSFGGRNLVLDKHSGQHPFRAFPEDRTTESNREQNQKLGSNNLSGKTPEILSSSARNEHGTDMESRKPSRHFTQGLSHERIKEDLIGDIEPNGKRTESPSGRSRSADSQDGKGNSRLPGFAERIGASLERVGNVVQAMKKLMRRIKKKPLRKVGRGR